MDKGTGSVKSGIAAAVISYWIIEWGNPSPMGLPIFNRDYILRESKTIKAASIFPLGKCQQPFKLTGADETSPSFGEPRMRHPIVRYHD
jgi:hypothetical protein